MSKTINNFLEKNAYYKMWLLNITKVKTINIESLEMDY